MTPPAARPAEWTETFDMWHDQAYQTDPHPRWAELRATCPVAHSSAYGGHWLVADQESAYRVLRDPSTFATKQTTVPDMTPEPLIPISYDPPQHTAWRSLLQPSFAPGPVKMFEPIAREAAVRLATAVAAKGGGDFMREFAMEYPSAAILPFIGVPPEALDLVIAWEEESMRAAAVDPDARDRARTETRPKVKKFFEGLVQERMRTGPTGPDVISVMITGEVFGRKPTLAEIVNACAMLLSAGLHTTAATLGNIVFHLAQHVDERDALTADPSRIPNAIEELMRYEGLVTTGRQCIRDTVLAGQQIRAGDPMLIFIPSVLRDAKVYDRPDEVDYDRPPGGTLAFGVGIHRCLGSHLARMELRVALEEIHRIMPNYSLVEGRPAPRHTGIHRTTSQVWLEIT